MDFFDRYFGWFIAIGIGLVIALAVASLVASERAHDAFMAACKKGSQGIRMHCGMARWLDDRPAHLHSHSLGVSALKQFAIEKPLDIRIGKVVPGREKIGKRHVAGKADTHPPKQETP